MAKPKARLIAHTAYPPIKGDNSPASNRRRGAVNKSPVRPIQHVALHHDLSDWRGLPYAHQKRHIGRRVKLLVDPLIGGICRVVAVSTAVSPSCGGRVVVYRLQAMVDAVLPGLIIMNAIYKDFRDIRS